MSEIFNILVCVLLLVLNTASAYQVNFDFTGIQANGINREEFRIVPCVDGNRVEKFSMNAYEDIGENAKTRLSKSRVYEVEYTGNSGELETLRNIECKGEKCSLKKMVRMTHSRMLEVDLLFGGNFNEHEGLRQENMSEINVYEHDSLEAGLEKALELGNGPEFTVYYGGETFEDQNMVTFKDLDICDGATLRLIFEYKPYNINVNIASGDRVRTIEGTVESRQMVHETLRQLLLEEYQLDGGADSIQYWVKGLMGTLYFNGNLVDDDATFKSIGLGKDDSLAFFYHGEMPTQTQCEARIRLVSDFTEGRQDLQYASEEMKNDREIVLAARH